MPNYPDRRPQYKGLQPTNFTPGTPKEGNPQTIGNYLTVPAVREGVPRDKFGWWNSEKNPQNAPPEVRPEPEKPKFDRVPTQEETEI